MRKKSVIALLLASSVISALASAGPVSSKYRQAVNLYRQGLYESARVAFENLGQDPVYEGYAVLCAGKMDSPDFPALLKIYDNTYPKTSFYSLHHYQAALNLFDDARYEEAAAEFDKVVQKEIGRNEQNQYIFKRGFCSYATGQYPDARKWLVQFETLPECDYSSPARFALGFMSYTQKDFDEALYFFGRSAGDKRLELLSNFYIVDCRFMKKDYGFVTTEGVALYDKVPAGRQIHLARIISEAYLVLGDELKAKEYFDKAAFMSGRMSDSEFFYAGSVMYALKDYEGAIENFTQIRDRSDSLGQIASYELANAYIQQRNKVAALDAFRDASELDFDKDIKEDAFFNRAKLAFDLNSDGSWFEKYLQIYNTSRKGEQIYSYMALSRLVNHDYAGSIEAYDKISSTSTEQDLNYLKANYLRANELVQAGAYGDAAPYLRSATVGLSPHDPFCQLSKYWLAECAYRTGDYDGAYTGFNALYNISALDCQQEGRLLPYNLAYSAFRKGDYVSAAKWFDRYVSGGAPDFRQDALNRRGDCDFARKDYEAAIVSYQKAIDAAGSTEEIYPYYRQALSYGLCEPKGRRQKKADLLEKKAAVLERVRGVSVSAPMYSAAVYELGRTYLDLGSDKSAIEVFRSLRRTATEPCYIAGALTGVGMAFTNLHDYESALGSYKEVVGLYPDTEYSRNALLAIESLYQTMGLPQQYLDYLEVNHLSDTRSGSDRDELYFNAAQQNFLAGDYAQAQKSLEDYVAHFPDGHHLGIAWYYLGECYEHSGNKEKAREAYATVMDQSGDGSYREASVLKFARLSQSLQHYDDAFGAYEYLGRIAIFDENKTEAKVGMMRAAYGMRNYDLAIECAGAVEDSREASYIRAKSYLATSRRPEALPILRELAGFPASPEGAEANYLLIQDAFDRGEFDKVPDMTYDFAPKAGDQNYWLARCFITLADAFVEQGRIKQAATTLHSLLDNYEAAGEGDEIKIVAAEKLNGLEN